jgi:hypothetical protein
MANELENSFFRRGCRAFIGTETKVPTVLASRFATVFFRLLFNTSGPLAIPAGEALYQARLFLWHRFRNIGGLFYTYINEYDLFIADDDEVENKRPVAAAG